MPAIAYLGPEHTNTHLAALEHFGARCRYVHAPTVDDVFSLAERDQADYGVVPVENSLEGAVTHTLDRFIDFKDSPVEIVGEIEHQIQHYLITRPHIKMSQIQGVYSHPQALAQCRKWLEATLRKPLWLSETSSTSAAIDAMINQEQEDLKHEMAAIGSKEAARKYRVNIIRIPEDRENKTRFLILSKRQPRKSPRCKTSVLFALKDHPGALHDALTPFKQHRINLTKIESRPSKRKAWEYLFFIDVEGSVADSRLKRALAGLKACTSFMRILGSYPATAKKR
jgi:chorismate mutase/prephenate dehydratase